METSGHRINWHTQVKDVKGVFFAKTIVMSGWLPAEKVLVWDALRTEEAEKALQGVLGQGHSFRPARITSQVRSSSII